MAQDLAGYIAGGFNLQTHAGHFKGTPMFVFGKIGNQAVARIRVILIGGVADPRGINYQILYSLQTFGRLGRGGMADKRDFHKGCLVGLGV